MDLPSTPSTSDDEEENGGFTEQYAAIKQEVSYLLVH
jgi:hypothetical protein